MVPKNSNISSNGTTSDLNISAGSQIVIEKAEKFLKDLEKSREDVKRIFSIDEDII